MDKILGILKMEVLEKGTLKKLGIINTFSLVTYTKYYQKVGTFELNCAITKDNISVLKDGNMLWIEDRVVGIISYINKLRGDKSSIIVKGPLINNILSSRYIWPMLSTYDYPEKILEQLIIQNCKQGARNFNSLVIGNVEVTSTNKQNYQQTGSDVASEAETLCSMYGFGYSMDFINEDEEEGRTHGRHFLLTIYHGKNKTLGNGLNSPILLGTDFNNLSNSSYTSDTSQYRNCAIVTGEGEGSERKSTLVYIGDTEPTGFDRVEVYIDARDVKSTNNDDVQIPLNEYIELLKLRGIGKMKSEYNKKESYEAEIVEVRKNDFMFGTDYYLGDMITVIDEDMQLKINTVVNGVTVSIDAHGRTVEPIFGYEVPTLYQKIKKGVV